MKFWLTLMGLFLLTFASTSAYGGYGAGAGGGGVFSFPNEATLPPGTEVSTYAEGEASTLADLYGAEGENVFAFMQGAGGANADNPPFAPDAGNAGFNASAQKTSILLDGELEVDMFLVCRGRATSGGTLQEEHVRNEPYECTWNYDFLARTQTNEGDTGIVTDQDEQTAIYYCGWEEPPGGEPPEGEGDEGAMGEVLEPGERSGEV